MSWDKFWERHLKMDVVVMTLDGREFKGQLKEFQSVHMGVILNVENEHIAIRGSNISHIKIPRGRK